MRAEATSGWSYWGLEAAGIGAPAAHRERQRSGVLGGGGGVGELHGGEEKLARGSIGGEEGRGRGLRGEVVLSSGNGLGGGDGRPRRWRAG